jgi:hypothetical protein
MRIVRKGRFPVTAIAASIVLAATDPATATYTNPIGSGELTGTWTDPSFDSAQAAVYYVRAIPIPTPIWYTP